MPHRADREATSRLVRLLDRGVEPEDVALATRLRGSGAPDPYTLLARAIRDIEEDRESSDSQVETALGSAIRSHEAKLGVMESRIDQRDAELGDLKRIAGTARWIVNGILAAAGVLGVYVLDRILTRAEREGETTIRLQVIERALDRIERQQDRDRNRPDYPSTPVAQQPTKP